MFIFFLFGLLMIFSAGIFIPDYFDHGRYESYIQIGGVFVVLVTMLFTIIVLDIRESLT